MKKKNVFRKIERYTKTWLRFISYEIRTVEFIEKESIYFAYVDY